MSSPSVIAHMTGTRGYAMAALLVAMSVMAVMTSVVLPVWQTAIQREREAELVFRGEQYAQAIMLFQRKYAGTFPPSVDVLVKQRFLRRPYLDPMTNDDFQVLYAGDQPGGRQGVPPGRGGAGPATPAQPAIPIARGGIIGVVSTSTDASLRLYNGRGRYNEWTFVATQATTQAGMPSGASPSPPARGRSGGIQGTAPPTGGARGTSGRSARFPQFQ